MRDQCKHVFSLAKVAWVVSFTLAAGAVCSADQKTLNQTTKDGLAQASVAPDLTTASFGDWVLRCQKRDSGSTDKTCEVVHSVTAEGQQGTILQLAIGQTEKQSERTLVVVVPVNISFVQTPQISVDANPEDSKTSVWLKCLPVACLANLRLDQINWKSSKSGKVSYIDGAGRPVVTPFSLNGLDRALNALDRQ